MKSKTSVILIGCGAVSQLFYAPALAELERQGLAQVVGLADPDGEACRKLLKLFPAATAFRPESLPVGKSTDLAIIASPPHLHGEQTIQCLRAGWNVLCEKPMAPSVEEGEAMISAAALHDRILAIGHYKRFFPTHIAIKQFIERETFGLLHSIQIWEGGKFGWPAASDSFFRKEKTPGGVFLDIGVHILDLLLWWLDEPLEFCYRDDALDGLEANALLTAQYSSGTSVAVRLSRDWRTLDTYVFRFQRATVHLRVNHANHMELTLDGIPMTFAAELRASVSETFPRSSPSLFTNPQAFVAQLLDVVSSVRENRQPKVPGAEGIRAIRWLSQCYKERLPLITENSMLEPDESTCA